MYKYDWHWSDDVDLFVHSFNWAAFIRSAALNTLAQMTYRSVYSSVQVKDIYLHPEQFTIENGLLTPTLKAKRAELKTLFQPQINQLYANMSWTN